ncbi:imidazoleglycerol-phosphate dehydratase HisB [Pelolinea submarina]|uniref:Imidazoleglycerol-phosphate dehydratase n=1 Tax=Pelolinea submarina TaxID=913107 RepID=A0A347ZTW4_9CHLR|nr:imidazoleglycerol-phosphate dehydratase HisB [Pelolinea submarina]REG10672.1 imidazoleglycerol-phosphate dehydratase [Pelolinea submarina]BBB48745.1 imidazoleglycerol-phosphate dehydratase [Pelolinea submarina]
MRTASVERKTNETDITLKLNLDGKGIAKIETGAGFFNHMLTQIAVHGLYDLEVRAKGDLEIDAHHLVEDCGLVLGTAFRQALGDKAGIVRIATEMVPMDESLGQVVVDFSGRPYAVVQTAWTAPMVANLPVSLLEHFFETFAMAAGCNLHVRVLYGRDNHHMAEALFKALARATAQAVQIDPRRGGAIPSSKGMLA